VSMVARAAFRDDDVDIAQALAAEATPALHSAVRARADARRQATDALADVSRLLSQTLDSDTVGQRATESVCRLLDASSAILYRASPDGTLVGEAVFADEFPWVKRLPAGSGLAGLALHERKPLFTADVLTDPRLTYSREVREAAAKSTRRALLAVPLLAQDQELGVLTVGDHTGRRFGEDDIRLVQAFADQTAVALQNARLYREASRRAARMSALAAVERLLSETLDAALVTRRIVETIGDLVDAQAARLFRADGDAFVLVAAAGDAGPRLINGLRFEPGTGLLALAVRDRTPVQSQNILDDERVRYAPEQRAAIEGARFRAILAAPLVVNQRVIGVLNVGAAAGRVWDDEDVALVQMFADQAARALENARLFADEQAARAAAQAAVLALRENEAVLQRAMQVGQIGSWTADLGTAAGLSWSDEVCRIFGVERSALSGTVADFTDRVHPDDTGKLEAARDEAMASNGQFSVEHRIVLPDGAVRWVHELADIQRDAQGRALRFIGVVQDITERKQAEEALQAAEEQLRQSQKMDAIGRLAGGVAHDFNNLLSIVLGRTELMRNREELSPALKRDVELIHRTAERAAALTRQHRRAPGPRAGQRGSRADRAGDHEPRRQRARRDAQRRAPDAGDGRGGSGRSACEPASRCPARALHGADGRGHRHRHGRRDA
jgi:PAS domain S-box-containing protein